MRQDSLGVRVHCESRTTGPGIESQGQDSLEFCLLIEFNLFVPFGSIPLLHTGLFGDTVLKQSDITINTSH